MEERYINPHTDFGFKRLFEQAEIAKFNDKELKAYEESVNAYRDIVNAINTAKKDSFAEGKAEGVNFQKLETAKMMLANGESIDKIIFYTGLSKEDVEELR